MVEIGETLVLLLSVTSLAAAVDSSPSSDVGIDYRTPSKEASYGAQGRGENGRGYEATKESDYQKESKYYYGGQFKDKCQGDGLYYKDDTTFVMCSNGYPHEQLCPPGTKTSGYPSYKAGYYYGYTDLCSVNLVDYGFGPEHYAPSVAYESEKEGNRNTESSYNGKLEGTYGTKETLQEYKDKDYSKPYNQKDVYPHADASYPKADAIYPTSESPIGFPSSSADYAQKDLYPSPSHGGYQAAALGRNYHAYDRDYPVFGGYPLIDPYAYPQRNPYNPDKM